MLERRDFTSESAYQSYLDTVADLKTNRRLVSQLDESVRTLSDSVYVLENQYTVQSEKNQKLEATLAALKSELEQLSNLKEKREEQLWNIIRSKDQAIANLYNLL